MTLFTKVDSNIQKQPKNFPDIRKALVGLSEIWPVMTAILETEIRLHGTLNKLASEARVNRTSISRFLKRECILAGSGTLDGLVNYLGSKYPELINLVLEIYEYREYCDNIGSLSFCQVEVIDFWTTHMEAMQRLGIDRSQIASQYGKYGSVVYHILQPRPSNQIIIEVANNIDEICKISAILDWDKVADAKKVTRFYLPKSIMEENLLENGQGNERDSLTDLELHKLFNETVNNCLEKLGCNRSQLVALCNKNGIKIGDTSFRRASKNGVISLTAKQFIKLAPSVFLNGNKFGEETITEKVPTEKIPKPVEATVENLVEVLVEPEKNNHDVAVGESFLFDALFSGQVEMVLNLMKLVIRASPAQREFFNAKFGNKLSELEGNIQALRVRNPLEVLSLLTNNQTHSNSQSARRRGKRNI